MDELKPCAGTAIFDFRGQSVRTKMLDGMPYFCLVDVCAVLDIHNARDCKERLNAKGVVITDTLTAGGKQQTTFINESNLYKVIFQSRKPNAEKFTEWVSGEVLPAIRQNGCYTLVTGEETLEELSARALRGLQAAIERQKMQIEEQQKQLRMQAPDVEYCREVLASANLHTINTVATHLGVSAMHLNRFLCLHDWIYRQGGNWFPTSKIRNKGYCDFHIYHYTASNGETQTRELLKWTETGRRAIIDLWNKNRKPASAANQ